MAKINPIETRYAGCRFRSRLEARWAVFFNHLGIAWEYEPQGFECQARLTLDEDPIPYLPDFWLPHLGIYGEVKGDLNKQSLTRLLNIAASLSVNNGGGCHDNGGNDLVVFGAIPDPTADQPLAPTRLHMHKGNLEWSPWLGDWGNSCTGKNGQIIAADYGGNDDIYKTHLGPGPDAIIDTLLCGIRTRSLADDWRDAYRAARSARFEHGESG